jgi:hypothetical protein
VAYVSTPENLKIVDALCQALRNLKIGETLSKKRIENLVSGKPHLLARARSSIEQEQGCILATVIGIGIKKIEPRMAHTVGEKARVKARRGLSKAQGQMVGVVRSSEGVMLAQDKVQLTNELNKVGLTIEFCR